MSDGAQIQINDGRVSSVQNWILGVVGAGIVGGIIWVGSSISGLRETVVRLVTQNEFILEQLRDHGQRIGNLERRP